MGVQNNKYNIKNVPIIFVMSVCLSLRKSRTAERFFIKIDTGELF
jgi:hypothetical protein